MAARKAPARKPARKTPTRKPAAKSARKAPSKTRSAKPKPALKVFAAVERDIAEIAKRDKRLAESGLAAAALALARELDKPKNSATSKSMCAKALRETLDRLRELTPPERTMDGIDDLAAKRATRRDTAGISAPADLPRS